MGRNEKIRVCHVISGDLWAGAEVQAYTMLKGLARIPDIDIMAIVLNEGKLTSLLRAAGVSVLVIDESKNGFFAILRKARELMRGRDIDIIHSHRRKENVLTGLLKRSRHAEHAVQTVHGASEPFKGIKWLKEKIYAIMNRYVTNRYFDHIMPVSDDLKSIISDTLRRGRLTTIHNSIDLKTVVLTKSASEFRQELGLPVDKPVIGSAGRMVPVKGFDVFVRAAAKVMAKRPEVSYVLAGEGPLSESLKNLAADLGITDRVRFPGFREDITDLLNSLDIFVVSSHHEGIPTVLLEAMALGKSVVCTGVGGINEIIEDGLSGILVEPGDAAAIAEACERLLDNADLRLNLGQAARRTVEDRFSSESQAGSIADIYRGLVRPAHEQKV
ncbi:MAG: glycosyltransferase family 4 protein [Candidatus Zixiibacteriota bacterium]|nr:MAG: glycosyltransferase family 4 protein [candidate division Zixibacteria bacterium]